MNEVTIKRAAKANGEDLSTSVPRRQDPASVVDSAMNKALKISVNKMGLRDTKALIDCIKKGDPRACNYCHYNLAKELAGVLGGLDNNIKAVYAYDYDDNVTDINCSQDASSFQLIRMIVWAERKTKALDALIESMDSALVQNQRRLLSLNGVEHMLDIQVIDDADVNARKGYAALLKSIHQPPIEVWRGKLG